MSKYYWSPPFRLALADLLRPRCWAHTGCTGSSYGVKEYEQNAPTRVPWRYKRGQWSRRLPSFGGDEWCRWTLVLPTILFGTFVIPLWGCRDPECESCQEDCVSI